MADYQPLLARAVSGLKDPTPETRRALYERARAALLAQMRSLDPPVPEADIARENTALDEAIGRLEKELAPATASETAQLEPASETAQLEPGSGEPTPSIATLPRSTRPIIAPTFRSATSGSGPPAGTKEAPKPAGERERPAAAVPQSAPATPPSLVTPTRVAITLVGLALVGGIAALAYLRRDTPDTLAKATPPISAPSPDQPAEPAPTGKIVGRITGAPPPGETDPTPAPAPAPAVPGAPVPAVPAPAPADVPAQPAIPVSHRAALLVQSDDPAQKVQAYIGTVVWRLEPVNSGSQAVQNGVRAEVDIPEVKFKASMLFTRNLDASLPASHTIELRIAASDPNLVVTRIQVPELRGDDQPTGDPLTGIVVPITDNRFLVGLSKADADMAHNSELMKTRGWFDVPMLLATKKVAKLTFEKGTSGARAISEAFASWQN
jgi:hypothetical protein